jgi:hypothetical protein
VIGELAVRFVLGGFIVSAFSVIGELFQPKSFSGIFGAAPSVALVTIALALWTHGTEYVSTEGRSMLVGAVALLAYSAVVAWVVKREHWPVWLSAGLSWIVWGGVAFALWAVWLR